MHVFNCAGSLPEKAMLQSRNVEADGTRKGKMAIKEDWFAVQRFYTIFVCKMIGFRTPI